MKQIDAIKITKDIIEWADESCGYIIDAEGINTVVKTIIHYNNFENEFVEELLDRHSTHSGHLIKAGEVIGCIKSYLKKSK